MLFFSVVPGQQVYINDVKISGNARTLDRVVRRDVYLAPGDMYNLTDLKDAKSKLKKDLASLKMFKLKRKNK